MTVRTFAELSEEDIQAWLNVDTVAVDIETKTQAPDGHPSSSLSKFGLSFVAPITDVGLYHPELGELAINLRGKTYLEYWKPGIEWWKVQNRLQHIPEISFILNVLGGKTSNDTGTPKRIIGHNVVFDLRHLGGHFGFTLPLGSRVWDTMIMGIRMMLGELDTEGFDLVSLAQRLEVLSDPKFTEFYNRMKKYRDKLDNFSAIVAELPDDDIVLEFAPEGVEHPDEKAQHILDIYVTSDAALPFAMYQRQFAIAENLKDTSFEWASGRVALKWPTIMKHVDLWERKMRIAANQAITGLDVDIEFLQEKIDGYNAEINTAMQIVINQTSDRLPEGFKATLSQLLFHDMVLGKICNGETYSNVKKKPYWLKLLETETVSVSKIRGYLVFSSFEIKGFETSPNGFYTNWWAEWLHTYSTPELKGNYLKKFGESKFINVPRPRINIQAFIQDSFREIDSNLSPAEVSYLSEITEKWFRHLFRLSEPLTDRTYVNKDLWKPYYMYAIAGMPFPSSYEIKHNWDITVARFQTEVKEYEDVYGEEPDYQALALDTRAFSVGTKALDFFLKEDGPYEERAKVLQNFRDMLQAFANLDRSVEFMAHAQLDGKVHSNIVPRTRTGRDSSSSPNLQNIKMEIFAGVFIAPEGYWLIEADYANAENKMVAAIGRDDNMAMATEQGDFHSEMAAIYFPDAWNKAQNTGNADELKRLRNKKGKPATFAIPYGVGGNKLAVMIGSTYQEAMALMENRKRRFPNVEKKKERVIENAKKRKKAGITPVWTSLWDGQRVAIPQSNYGKREHDYYKSWNYLQQGGVAAMMHSAMVEAVEWLEERGLETYIALNIHDSFIIVVSIGEYYADESRFVLSNIFDIMASQVPEKITHATNPPIHFISEVGFENSRKWGFRPKQDYPFPAEEFVNRWGCHTLDMEYQQNTPRDDWEAPTWVGPVHLGYSLEEEMRGIKHSNQVAQKVDDNGGHAYLETNRPWREFQDLTYELGTIQENIRQSLRNSAEVLGVGSLHYVGQDGEAATIGPFDFANKMTAARTLWHKGHLQREYPAMLESVKELLTLNEALVECTEQIEEWIRLYGELADTSKP